MRIALDVMGGDHGCEVALAGAKLALETDPNISTLLLVGQQEQIQPALHRTGLSDARVQVVHASEVLTMDDKPSEAIRQKDDSSMVRAIELVYADKADAVVSPGNTTVSISLISNSCPPLEVSVGTGDCTCMKAHVTVGQFE